MASPALCSLLTWSLGMASAVLPLRINELLADPAGPDAGAEFVEIVNPSGQGVDLQGVGLEFANGADGIWRRRWTGGPGEVLSAGAVFLLADRGWTGAVAADAEVSLELQNGPDAVRLVVGGEVLDLLGYGEGLPVHLAETRAAAVAPGRSLARRPDGHDTQDNAADFHGTVPTPGAENYRPWALSVAAVELEPPSLPAPGPAVRLAVSVRNTGWRDWPAGTLAAVLGSERVEVAWSGCAADSLATVVWQGRPAVEGVLSAALAVPDGAGGSVDLAVADYRVGPAGLVLQEVMAAPRAGQGEWLELLALEDLELGGYRLRDADGPWLTLPAFPLAAGQRIVLAADGPALLARETGMTPSPPCQPDPDRVLTLSAWPSLNNTQPSGRTWADRVLLSDPFGMVVDHVTLGDAGTPVPEGRSWERADLSPVGDGWNWGPSRALPGGTPGCPNSLAPPPGAVVGRLDPRPRVLDPLAGDPVIHITVNLPQGVDRWWVTVHDLWGATVRTWPGDGQGGGVRHLPWAGEDDRGRALPPGGYVVLLACRSMGDPVPVRDRVLVVVR